MMDWERIFSPSPMWEGVRWGGEIDGRPLGPLVREPLRAPAATAPRKRKGVWALAAIAGAALALGVAFSVAQAQTPAQSSPEVAETIAALEAAVAEAELELERVRAYDEIDNVIRAYGYYLDKNMWDDLADLFAEDGSIELAQRGVYVGRERVREFLHTVFGEPGPAPGRLGDHVQVQPVIVVSEDGQSAIVRSRVLQMMGFAGRSASWVGGVYLNEFVKEDGVWKIKTDHAFNVFMAPYEGGWAHTASQTLPGQSDRLAPDLPPSQVFRPFPSVIDIPFTYPNPVTGE